MTSPDLAVILAASLNSIPEIYRNQRAIVLYVCIGIIFVVRLMFPKISRRKFKYIGAALLLLVLAVFTKTNPKQGPAGAVGGDPLQVAQRVIIPYMQSHATSPDSVHIVEWSDLVSSGPDTLVTVRYNAALPAGGQTTATVRFTVRDGSVVSAQVLEKSS